MIAATLAGVATSRIGFGCGRLVGGAGMKASARLVETALGLGIRHFDTAPSYGLGTADDVLGAALGGQQDVTIVTKVGQQRPSAPGMKALARQVLRPLLSMAPGIKARLAKAAGPGAVSLFSPADIEASLAESLRRLRRAQVTGVMLHEISPQHFTPEVDGAMQAILADGRTLALGSGTGRDLADLQPYGTISQYRWSPADTGRPGGDVILHGVLRHLPRPERLSPAQSDALRRLGRDPADPQGWAGLCLTLALVSHPGAVVLVSTTSADRLAAGVGAIDWAAVERADPDTIATMRSVLATG